MAYNVSMHFVGIQCINAIMLQFLAVQTTEDYVASPFINLSTFQLPARLILLINKTNTRKRSRALMMAAFIFASNEYHHFYVKPFPRHHSTSSLKGEKSMPFTSTGPSQTTTLIQVLKIQSGIYRTSIWIYAMRKDTWVSKKS